MSLLEKALLVSFPVIVHKQFKHESEKNVRTFEENTERKRCFCHRDVLDSTRVLERSWGFITLSFSTCGRIISARGVIKCLKA